MSPSIAKDNNPSPEETAPVAAVEEKKRSREEEELEITEKDREEFEEVFQISSSSEPAKKKQKLSLKNPEEDRKEEEVVSEKKEEQQVEKRKEEESKEANLTEREVQVFKKQLELIISTGEPSLALLEELQGISRRQGLAHTELIQQFSTLENTVERLFLDLGLYLKRNLHCISTQETTDEIRDQLRDIFEPIHYLSKYNRQLRAITGTLLEDLEDKLQAGLQIRERFHNSGVITYPAQETTCTDKYGATIFLGDKVRAELEPKNWDLAIVVQLGQNNCVYITPKRSGRTYCKFACQVEVWEQL